MTTIGILIPVHDGERWLDAAIQSVLRQTHQDLELLIVDDDSADRSVEIAMLWALRDPRVRVLEMPARLGISAALNAGLCQLSTEWVARLDADDVMLPDRLATQLRFAEQWPSAAVVAGRAEYARADGRRTGHLTERRPIGTPDALRRHLERDGFISVNHPSTMLHRERVLSVGGYRNDHDGAEDGDLWNRLVEHGYDVLQQPDVVTLYRVHDAAAMSARARQCWETAAWTRACVRARRAGYREPSREEWVMTANRSPWRRLRFAQEINGNILWRAAGAAWINGRWLRGVALGTATACLRPALVARRVLRRLQNQDEAPRGVGLDVRGSSFAGMTPDHAAQAREAEWRRRDPDAAARFDYKMHGGGG